MKRRPNSPYFKLDIAGRLVVNAYKTAEARNRAIEPAVQRIREDGTFDCARGLFFRFGKVGVYAAHHYAGPGFYKARGGAA